jgi:hypothetical protein
MTDDAPGVQQRRSRFWLFAPIVLLGLVVAGWTTAWFVIRDRASRAVDAWLAREAALGRQWSCPNRTLGGFPFRIEIACDSLTLQRPDFRVAVGPVAALAQVYRPRHIIAQVSGPLHASDGRVTVTGNWQRLEASLRAAPEGLQRVSLVSEAPTLSIKGIAADDLAVAARHVETHVRAAPSRPASEGAYDWSLAVAQARLPPLDGVAGDTAPADLDLQLTATQVRDARARPLPAELDRWRAAGGRLEVARLAIAKGVLAIEAKGVIGLDEARRLQGRIEASAAGIEPLLANLLRAPSGLSGAILGGGARLSPDAAQALPKPGAQPAKPDLKPLPPLRLDSGRVFVGPIAIPGIRLPPLY